MRTRSRPAGQPPSPSPNAKDPPKLDDDIDLTLRDVSRRFPDHFARALLPPGSEIADPHWPDTQVTKRQRRLDRALSATVNGERRLLHAEWQLEMEADVPFRLFEYHVLLAFALAGATPKGEQTPPIDSVLVLLSGREQPWPEEGEYRTSSGAAPFSGVRYRIDAVYQRTVAEITARGPLWSIFAPLAIDADPVQMKRVLSELKATTEPRDFTELSAAMTVMADADKRRRGLSKVIIPLLDEEVVMQSSVFKMGVEKGIEEGLEKGLEKGLEPLALLFERKLGRTLEAPERAMLMQRLTSLGPDRLLDAGLDLSPEALRTWLADPAAT
jgi:hypothetical protein